MSKQQKGTKMKIRRSWTEWGCDFVAIGIFIGFILATAVWLASKLP